MTIPIWVIAFFLVAFFGMACTIGWIEARRQFWKGKASAYRSLNESVTADWRRAENDAERLKQARIDDNRTICKLRGALATIDEMTIEARKN